MDNPNLVQFQDVPTSVTNSHDIVCTYYICHEHTPHRLDKIHLCPINSTDLQDLNTWDFVSCLKTDNPDYPYQGTVSFACEKYAFLVLDHPSPGGYQLRYVTKDGGTIGESKIFSILLEETESATMGMSYVFLNNELNSSQLSSSDMEPKLEPKPELTLEPVESTEPVSKPQSEEDPGYAQEPELRIETETMREEPSEKSSFPEFDSLNLSNPGESLFPLNLQEYQTDKKSRSTEQMQFLTQTLQDLRAENQSLDLRYANRRLECELLTRRVDVLEEKQQFCEEVHKEGFGILTEGLTRLNGVLCPDKRTEQVPGEFAAGLYGGEEDLKIIQGQIEVLVRAADKLILANQEGADKHLKKENERLKEEYQSLTAVVKDYENQLILTNQEQAKTSEKMTQLSKENDILKTYEQIDPPPPSTASSRRYSDLYPNYPPRPRPRHVTCNIPQSTESIIMTEPARGKSSPTFASVAFLKSCSIHSVVVQCPICDAKFEGTMDTLSRTKHVNECMKRGDKIKCRK